MDVTVARQVTNRALHIYFAHIIAVAVCHVGVLARPARLALKLGDRPGSTDGYFSTPVPTIPEYLCTPDRTIPATRTLSP